MTKPNVFISYCHADEDPWKNRLQKHLEVLDRRGSLSFWEDRQIAAGAEWRAEINAALESAEAAILLISVDFLRSKFIRDEEVPAILQRRAREGMKIFPLLLRSCSWQKEEWLSNLQIRPTDGNPLAQFDKDDDIDRVLTEFATEIETLLKQPTAPKELGSVAEPKCPYLGLEAFTEDKRHLFFGRDKFIEAIWQKFQARQFLAVVGPSGCGKSSVIQAGVFPRLGNEWRKLVFQPGDDPFLNLADKFVEARGESSGPLSKRIKAAEAVAQQIKDNRSIAAPVAETLAALPTTNRLLLVADQFEELFTLTPVADRQPFVEALLTAAHVAELKVLVTLRADFLGQAISLTPELSQWLQDGVVFHQPLERADWEAVILQPAKTVGLHIDPALVALILEEIAAQPDSLPLLEYALKELWQQRTPNGIGLTEYEAIGRLASAINQRADTVLAQLSEEDQKLALRALTRLVRVSGGEEEGADTRLRLPLNELTAEQRAILQSFINERLLVTNRHDRTGEETIEVAHEALIRQWQKLRETLDSNREFLVWRRRLNVRRNLWEQNDRDDTWLLLGGEYNEAHRWLSERSTELIQNETEFISWADRADYQIEVILTQITDLASASFVPVNGEQQYRRCFFTLTLCRSQAAALTFAQEVADCNARANALAAVASALKKNGLVDHQVRLAILSALRDAKAVKNTNNLLRTLAYVGNLATELGLANEVLQLVKGIDAKEIREQALVGLTSSFIENGMAEVILREGRQLNEFENQAQLLSVAVGALARLGRTGEARQVTTDAIAVIKNIGSILSQAYALSTLCSVLTSAKQVDLMQQVADELLRLIDNTEEKSARVGILSSVAYSFLRVGQLKQAEAAAIKALRTAESIEDAFAQTSLFPSAIEILVRLGLKAEVLRVANKMHSNFRRDAVKKDIAEALMRAGLAQEALSLANEIDVARIRSLTLSAISKEIVKSGRLIEALDVAHEIEDDEERSSILAFVAEAFAKARQPEKALQISKEISDPYQRVNAQAAAANSWLDSNDVGKAQEVVAKVQAAIERIHIDMQRSIARERLASLLARLHWYRDARKIADLCAYSGNRLAAYTDILREYHLERDPSLARFFNEEAAEAEEED